MSRAKTSGPTSDPETIDALAVSPVTPTPVRGRSSWAAAFVLVVLILALLGGFIFFRLETLPFRVFGAGTTKLVDWAGKVRDAFVAVAGMQPRVTVHEQVVYEQSKSVLELAVLERDTSVEREIESTWMGSTKRLRVRGLYHVKAGYDLTRPFTVSIDGADAAVVRLQMPAPRMLTVELDKLEVLTMDNGLWNHLTKDEIAIEVNALGMEARRKAWQEGTPAEAQRMFVERLQEKLGPDHRLEVSTPTPAPPSLR